MLGINYWCMASYYLCLMSNIWPYSINIRVHQNLLPTSNFAGIDAATHCFSTILRWTYPGSALLNHFWQDWPKNCPYSKTCGQIQIWHFPIQLSKSWRYTVGCAKSSNQETRGQSVSVFVQGSCLSWVHSFLREREGWCGVIDTDLSICFQIFSALAGRKLPFSYNVL